MFRGMASLYQGKLSTEAWAGTWVAPCLILPCPLSAQRMFQYC